MKAFVAFIEKYMMTPADRSSNAAAYGYQSAALLGSICSANAATIFRARTLCGRPPASRTHWCCRSPLPGVKINTSPTDYRMVRQYQLQRFDGEHWKLFGDLMSD